MKEFEYIKKYITERKEEYKQNYITKNADNKRVMLKLVGENGENLYYASDRLKDDFDVVNTAIKSSTDAYFYASSRLQKDEKVAETFLKSGKMRDTIIILKSFSNNKTFVKKCISYYIGQNIDNVDAVLKYCDKELQNDEDILSTIPQEFQGRALRGCFAKTYEGEWLQKFLNGKTNLSSANDDFFKDSVFCTAVEYTGVDRIKRDLVKKNIDFKQKDNFFCLVKEQLHTIVTAKHEALKKSNPNLEFSMDNLLNA